MKAPALLQLWLQQLCGEQPLFRKGCESRRGCHQLLMQKGLTGIWAHEHIALTAALVYVGPH